MNIFRNKLKNAIAAGQIQINPAGGYFVLCPSCRKYRNLKSRDHLTRAIKQKCNSCAQHISKLGKKFTSNHRTSLSDAQKNRYSDPNERYKACNIAKIAMHRPDVRQRHLNALHHSKWIKVRTDKGQVELLEKWNKLGFRFILNYQIRTKNGLFYIDGYDEVHNVVFEFDSKYHNKRKQQEKDEIREKQIINFLNPRVFWRYNAVTGIFNDIYRWRNVRLTTETTEIKG